MDKKVDTYTAAIYLLEILYEKNVITFDEYQAAKALAERKRLCQSHISHAA